MKKVVSILNSLSDLKLRLSVVALFSTLLLLSLLANSPETASGLTFWGFGFTFMAPNIRNLFRQAYSNKGPKMAFNFANLKSATAAAVEKHRTNTQIELDRRRLRSRKHKK